MNLLKIQSLLIAQKLSWKNRKPHQFKWNKRKLETISFGHGITTTPLQASALYAAMINGGNLIKPSLIKDRKKKN